MTDSVDFFGEEELRQQLRRRFLRRGVERALTERQREVMKLCYEEGLTCTAAAARLHVSPSTVSRTRARALRRLRSVMEYCE